MNILGHAYVASKAVKGSENLLVIGSLLPESSPFIADSPFTWEEIHESGEKLLRFLDKNNPKARGLALGILAHSKEFGADKFNKLVEDIVGEKKEELARKIVDCSGVRIETARERRLHNYLWWGMDLWILKTRPEFVVKLKKIVSAANIEEISAILSEAFSKDQSKVQMMMEILFKDMYRPEDLNSSLGLARIWSRQVAGLPDKDEVDCGKTALLFEEIFLMFQNKWEEILGEVVNQVKENLKIII